MKTTNVLHIALAQMDPVWENKEKNKKTCERFVAEVAKKGAMLVVFPEMTLTGFTMRARELGEEESDSDTIGFFSSLAKQYKVAILFGVIFFDGKKARPPSLRSGASGRGKNMAVTVDSAGRMISAYQKIHPFSFGEEDRHYVGGDQLSFFTLLGWCATAVVCYDLRFPGLFEAIAKNAPDIIFVIANWPESRIDHWKTLLAARALDTQAYVIGVNRVGVGVGLVYPGGSAVYAPNGALVYDAKAKAGAHIVSLDKKQVVSWRKQFPSLKDKKSELYTIL